MRMRQAREPTIQPGLHMLAVARLIPLLLALGIGGLVGCGDRDVPGTGSHVETAQGSDVAGWIEVAVTRADGKPATGATAYAVRVGRVSQTGMPDWPQADVDAAGSARIPVPAAGTYDVGVVFPSKEQPRALVADVRLDAGATKRVIARLPTLAPVDVTIEGLRRWTPEQTRSEDVVGLDVS